MKDRFGLSWRPELATGILSNLRCVDVIEVIAEEYLEAPRSAIRGLKMLSSHVPVILHAVSLGMASSVPVDTRRLQKMARLMDALEPESWSEHLAFVRGGDYEIGHLAAPPRTAATIEGAAKNLRSARQLIGTSPLVENIASLIDPPASRYDESAWIAEILSTSGCDPSIRMRSISGLIL